MSPESRYAHTDILWSGKVFKAVEPEEWEKTDQYSRFALISQIGAPPYGYFILDPSGNRTEDDGA